MMRINEKFKNHWCVEKVDNPKIGKLDENMNYQIKNVEKIETSFGKRYVLIDEENERFWPNKSIEQFIREHKDVKQFEINTSEFKTFKNKKGEEIRYLDVDINY